MTQLAFLLVVGTPYFKVQVVDDLTGRGVPLVEFRTVNSIVAVTDSNGLIAWNEPELMNRDVYFHVFSHGYHIDKDGFGYRGVKLTPRAGDTAVVKIHRDNIAERICRLTGEGIYRDSELLGVSAPIPRGPLTGQDTAQAIEFRGKWFWFWGDTDRASYPLGNFHTTGALASFPKGQRDASRGVKFDYFTGSDGFVREMIGHAKQGPIWVSGLAVLDGNLYCHYSRMKSLEVTEESGYLKWDDTKRQFNIVQTFSPDRSWRILDGHAVAYDGWIAGNLPLNVRVKATTTSYLEASQYQAFTCLNSDGSVKRSSNGAPDYRWQSELPPITAEGEQRLVKERKLKREEAWMLPQDSQGNEILPANGSVRWNAYRKRWVMVFGRKFGTDSVLGEIYYAEALKPEGPWRRAVKILTHDRYTFYNPVHHPFLDADGGRTIYLEGTYTAEFSGNPTKTPRYNYNQILYRLDLADSRLKFAQVAG